MVEGNLVGYCEWDPEVDGEDPDAFTMCLDCADDREKPDGKNWATVHDDAFGTQVPHPECHLCGSVMRRN